MVVRRLVIGVAPWLLFITISIMCLSSVSASHLSDSSLLPRHHRHVGTKDEVAIRAQEAVGGHERVDDVERRAKGSYGGGDLLRPRAGGKKNAAPASSMMASYRSCIFSFAGRLAVSAVMSVFFLAF